MEKPQTQDCPGHLYKSVTAQYNFINGQWTASSNGETFESANPATGQLLDKFPKSTAGDVDKAVSAAKKAYSSWRKTPVAKRGELLLKAMRILTDKKEAYASEMTKEMGKIIKETRGDVQEAIDTAFYFAGEGRRFFGQTSTSELPDKFSMSMRMPIGVCGFITPWNFPMAIPSWKAFPAMLCGNTMVIKPAVLTPYSVVNFAKALQEAGVPDGVFNIVHGSGTLIGKHMLKHRDISLISFTGSSGVGSEIGAECGRTFKKCCLEMGGKNAEIVMEDADLDIALEGALWGAFGTTGQRCTATSRVLVHEKVYKEFVERLVEKAKKIKVGNGLDETTEMGPCVSAGQLQTVHEYVEIARSHDKAKLLCGGNILTKGEYAKGYFHEPTIFEGSRGMRIFKEEIFGPVLTVVKIRNFEEAVETHNDCDYGLSSAIYTRDVNRVMSAIRDLEAGITYINAPTIGAEVHMPFGGVKQTGNGHRESGITALDIFSEWKTVYIDYSGKLQKAQIDTAEK